MKSKDIKGPGAVIVIPPAPLAPEVEAKTKAEKFLEDVRAMTVTTEEDKVKAIDMLVQVKALKDKSEKDRDELLNPAKATVKAIQNRWKPAEQLFEQVDQNLRPKIIAFNKSVEAKAIADMQALQAKIASGNISRPETIERKKAEILAPVPQKTVYTGSGAATTRKIKKLKIKDGQVSIQGYRVDKTLIPNEFWKLDEVALRKAVVVEGRVVPGADFEFDDSLSIF